MKTVDFEARCLISSIKNQLGDIAIKKITKEEYDSTEHDSNTIYYVQDGDKIVQYFGDTKLTSGSIAGSGNLTGIAQKSIVGVATFEPIIPQEVENT